MTVLYYKVWITCGVIGADDTGAVNLSLSGFPSRDEAQRCANYLHGALVNWLSQMHFITEIETGPMNGGN